MQKKYRYFLVTKGNQTLYSAYSYSTYQAALRDGREALDTVLKGIGTVSVNAKPEENAETSANIAKIIGQIPSDQLRELSFFRNRGHRFIRSLIDDETGRREKYFSDVFKEYHENNTPNMNTVIGEDSSKALIAAATLFQWLGTNNGRVALLDALKRNNETITKLG